MLFNYYIVLFMPCLFLAQAVSTQRSGRKGTPATTVVGTGMLDAGEVAGGAPLFVDAFYDHAKPVAHILLNMKSFLTMPTKADVRRWGPETEWSCEWTAPGANRVANVSLIRNATVEASVRDDTALPSPHWALVIYCPRIPALKGLPSVRLNLRGKYNGSWVYDRYDIPVSESRFVKRDTDFAICTMVYRGPLTTAEYLKPWAQYHLAAGFSQLLVYVEENDTSWVEGALRKFIQKGQVSIVPFYFGKISDRKDFIMQGAMENHCLYQARGMAKWIAHIDVDEYFDFLRPDVNMRNYPLPKSDSSDVALVVRNQFWGTLTSSHRVNAPYPCHLNAKSAYIHQIGKRSKVIMRPEYIDVLFPHFVVKKDGYTELHPDPIFEMRLNHFKWCDTQGGGCFGTNQSDMGVDVGRKTFHKRLMADDSDWHTRCSDMLAANQ